MLQDICEICNEPKKRLPKKHEHRVSYLRVRDGDNCLICNFPIAFKDNLQVNNPVRPSIDHIIEISNGGCNHPKNLRLCHYFCNTARPLYGTEKFEIKHKRKVIGILKELKIIDNCSEIG